MIKFKQLLLVLSALLLFACGEQESITRESDFNFGWKFRLSNDTTSLTNVPLADADWREVRLPHDWSVEASFDSTLEGCTGYLPGGVGVYQKHFETPVNVSEKSAYVLFDGVYNNATFWINGQLLGENPYGYSPVYFDLTPYLNADDKENVITVHVDHSRYADSRWYTGSGIYRNVKLVTVDKLHIPIWGTFITTPEISDAVAKVSINIDLENQYDVAKQFTLSTVLLDAQGQEVATTENNLDITANAKMSLNQELNVTNPQLWSPEHPTMYKSLTSVMVDGKMLDQYSTPFGIRTLAIDKDKGFFLNGKSTFVRGVCLHHDGGLVGSAVPEGVWRRRLGKLKEAGVNAIRTSHNPFAEDFLDLCDEMGFLVQNELFDEMDNPKDKRFNLNEREVLYRTRGYTEHFQEWGQNDLKRVMLRDRNHPSVFQWSIGNEIEWTYKHYKHVSGLWDPERKGGYWNATPHLTADEMKARYDALPEREHKLAETAQRLSGWVKEMDTTRPVTANLIIPVASCASGYASALDVVGFSYQIAQYDWCKKNYPDMLFTGSENSGNLAEWNSIIENPMVFSMYMWTGIDYMGESNLKWPRKAFPGDLLDVAGFEKGGFNHFKSIWVNTPHISLNTQLVKGSKYKVDPLSGKVSSKSGKAQNWDNNLLAEHWNYKSGEMVIVEVCSNLPTVELFLNGESLGMRGLSESPDRLMRWAVPFEGGVITAKGGFDGAEVEAQLLTAFAPASIVLTSDKGELAADAYDVAHLIAQLVDKDGVPVKTEESEITFEIVGDVRLLGVDNGYANSTQDYQTNKVITHQGQCLAIIQSKKSTGYVRIIAKAKGISSRELVVQIK